MELINISRSRHRWHAGIFFFFILTILESVNCIWPADHQLMIRDLMLLSLQWVYVCKTGLGIYLSNTV